MAELLHPHIIIDCEQLIQRLTIEKQVLIDENESADYDDNYEPNQCETPVYDKRRSEKYMLKINDWMAEYSDIKLISNIDAFDKRIDEFIDQLQQISNEIPICVHQKYVNEKILNNSIENDCFEDKFAEIVPQNIWNMEGVYPNSVFFDQTRVQSFGKWSDFGHSVFDENFRTALFCYQKASDNEEIFKKAMHLYLSSKKYVSALLYFRCLLDTEQYKITATIYVIKILLKTLDKGLIEFCEQELLVNINEFIPEEIARTTRYGILDKLFYNSRKADHYFGAEKYLTALFCYRKINDSKLIHKRMLELYSKKEYSDAMSYCLCLFSVTDLKPYLTVKITKLLLKEFNQNYFNKIANLFKPNIHKFIPNYVWNMNRVVNNDIFYSEILVNCFGDWKATADFYFDDSKYEIALFCYQRANDPNTILEKAAQLRNENRNEHSVLYYRYLLSEKQFANIAALNLIKLSVSLNYTKDVHDLALIASKQFNNCPAIQEYVSNLKQLQVFVDKGYKIESSFESGLTLTKTDVNTFNSLMDNCDPNFNGDSQNLKYEYNIEEILLYIQENNCHSFAGFLYEELSKRQDINNYSAKYKAFLYFLRGVQEINNRNFNSSLNHFKEALCTYPHKEIITYISKFFSNNHIKAGIKQFYNDLKETFLNFPVFHIYTERLKSSTLLRTVSKFEKGVNDSKVLNNLEKAMHYIDFTMQCTHPTIVTMNFLLSANYLYEEMLESSDAAKLYAYRNTICEFVANILFFSQRFMDPIMTTHFIRNSISLLYNANIHFNSFVVNNDSNLDYSKKLREVNIIDDFQLNLITFSSNIVTPFLEITPLIRLPLTLSSDSLFLCLISSEICEEYYNNALKCLNNDEKNAYKYDYCLIEGSYKGWANSDRFLEYRENCMNTLMTRNEFKQSQIENIISWNVINRDIDGWIDFKNTDLRLEGLNFDSVEGIVIDISKGTFNLLLSPSEQKPGLFNTSDIVEILSNGISGGLFYLEEPEGTFQCHPFQQMKYGPQSIADTNYLMTLLHADYMLKMITMQTEVCAKWPHVLRDANHGFMKNLPKEIRKLISMDKSKQNYCQSHKFWIEAKALPYKTTKLGNNVVEYRFNYCPFAVKTDLFRGYENKKLIDDCNDSGMQQNCDAEDKKMNSEKLFAKNFTEFYDKIGSYFPVFLRLRELLKLNAVSLFLKSVFLNLESVKRNQEIDSEKIKLELNNLKQNLNYPIYSESKVDSVFRATMESNGTSNENYMVSSERDRVRRDIESKLRDDEQQLYTDIATHLCKSINIDYSNEMRNNVCVWLENNCSDLLVNYMRNKMEENGLKKLSKFGDTLKQLGISTDDNEMSSDFNQQTCSWIPSVFNSNDRNKVYGGIVLQPNLVETNSNTDGDHNISNDDESSRNHVENENNVDQQANKTNEQFIIKSSCVSVEPKRLIKMNFSSSMEAYEEAKRAGDNNEPMLHYRDAKHNPTHYHPINLYGQKAHCHYFFSEGN